LTITYNVNFSNNTVNLVAKDGKKYSEMKIWTTIVYESIIDS